jgi:hypothetical protein
MQHAIPGLYGAAVRIFGTYDNALRAAGIDPSTVRQRRAWSKDEVIRQMRLFLQRHGKLTSTLMRKHDSGLERVMLVHFGNLESARRAAVAQRNGHSTTRANQSRPARLARAPVQAT